MNPKTPKPQTRASFELMELEAAGPAEVLNESYSDYGQEVVRPRRTYKLGEELTPDDVAAFAGEFECIICYSMQPLDQAYFVKGCRDFFCLSCFSENLGYLVEKEGNLSKLKCPKC